MNPSDTSLVALRRILLSTEIYRVELAQAAGFTAVPPPPRTPWFRNIVLMRPVNSMIEFKQIIGRGTRLFDGNDYFTILDFVRAYERPDGRFDVVTLW
jgi:hypothetical protein